MGAVVDRLEITVEEARAYLRAEPHVIENGLLTALINAAKEDADEYLNNSFTHTDENGVVTVQPIPFKVRLWVLQQVVRDYEQRASGLHQVSTGIGVETWQGRNYKDIARFRRNPGW